MLFKDVIGQQAIKDHLIRTVKENKVSHAYLLTGNEGAGGLAIAMAFARYLNCLNPGEHDSCCTCNSCNKAAKMIHPDIHFVYPVVKKGSSTPVSDDFLSDYRKFTLTNPYFSALQWFSQIGDDKKSGAIYSEESQSIIRKLSLKNFEGKYKVMIIWLPEKMNDAGANKLLKILEEPPLNTVFMLVSENPGALLGTIVSRTQQIAIPPIETAIITEELVRRFSITTDNANALARLSLGNYVKALENFDTSGDKSGFMDMFMQLMRATYSRKIFDIFAWAEAVAPLSRDRLKNFLVYSIGMLRDSFLYNYHQQELVFLNEKEDAFVSKFSPFITYDNIMKMVEELELAYAHIDQNGNAKIVMFDMAVKMVGFFKK
ncbi:MAG: DNA polymerase III subunit delta [Bacteroidales bacterium]|jgi:DNA polymerase-3 subunit delta'|nr:DNA polymerase III subunit delta [Bacteroidales bacterium]